MLNRIAVTVVSSAWVMASGVLASAILLGPSDARAQAGGGDLLYRVERLENQIRQLTGEIEQLQYRNQQLEAALSEGRYQDAGNRGGRAPAAPPAAAAPPLQPAPAVSSNGPYGGSQSGTYGGRRSDVFDPEANPNAPGVPRSLGSTPPQPPPPNSRPGMSSTPYATGNYAAGAPGADTGYGRPADADYGRPAAGGAAPQAAGPPYAVATAPPSSGSGATGSPQEIYSAGVSYLQRRDYAAAEDAFRDFLRRYPSDRRAPDAQFSLGESLYQRQSYQDAADAFVALSKKYESSAKAPDALLRLGQSLVALNERELACVAFGDVSRKYPRAQPSVRQAVEREQKRAGC